MIRKTYKPGQIVAIEWHDAFRTDPNQYWHAAAELDHDKSLTMQTVGYFVRQSDRFLTIAQTIEPGDDDTQDNYGGTFNIPTPCIHTITRLGD